MAFMNLKTIVFKIGKKIKLVYMLPCLVYKRSDITILLSREGASVQILML